MARAHWAILTVLPIGAVVLAAPTAAAPDCIDSAPFTRVCANPGHTAITTTPNPNMIPNSGWGYGWGTPVIGIGGGGIWIGF